MLNQQQVTGAEAGLAGIDQIIIALEEIERRGGLAQTRDIYAAVETRLGGRVLSEQGRASLRRLVNHNAVKAGFIYKSDSDNGGWAMTAEGKKLLNSRLAEREQVVNLDTGKQESKPSQTIGSIAFEQAVLELLKKMYSHYAWYHQGIHKANERGLDLIGTPIGEQYNDHPTIGVQVKLHAINNAPTDTEWLKFLAGCFTRRIGRAIFVTTGRLTGNQRREAGEAEVTVIEGINSLTQLCKTFEIDPALFTELLSKNEEADPA